MRLILLISLFTLSLWGGKLNWAASYEEAEARAIKENKSILLVMSRANCRWCQKLKSTTLKDDSIVDRINAKFIPVNLTRDKDRYPRHIKAKSVPKSFFLLSNGEPIIRGIVGYWSVEDYHSIMDDVERAMRKHP